MKKLDEKLVDTLSQDMFNYSLKYDVDLVDILSVAPYNIPVNDVQRLGSGNPFVSEYSFEKISNALSYLSIQKN
ncbi:hypothetical protein [Leuconostoc fallax]|uniref:hypothetical protein n=1 Tax=Leuconostoc fallax TaxID=1251 RepID=UPI00020D9A30|nr:hypothetical protein [Leuconostoc fallax]